MGDGTAVAACGVVWAGTSVGSAGGGEGVSMMQPANAMVATKRVSQSQIFMGGTASFAELLGAGSG